MARHVERLLSASVCAQTAVDNSGAPRGPGPRQQRITPIQWAGLAALAALFLWQAGILRLGQGGIAGYVTQVLPLFVALVLAITVHEFSHGLVATLFNDPTPRQAGRLTLNPIKHLDPVGTILILIGAPIGWGKPMPINPGLMTHRNLGWALSSAAGPISNILTATLVVVLMTLINPQFDTLSLDVISAFILINVRLAAFNLLPIPPLDGFGFVFGLAPRPLKIALAPLLQYGMLILLAVLLIPALSQYLQLFLATVQHWIFTLIEGACQCQLIA